MNERLYEIVLTRLDKEILPDGVAETVLAACRGAGALGDLLGASGGRRESVQAQSLPASAVKGTFLARLSVRGFRGIGRESVLELEPGPGLTLVVGRNGSGKSSFSEALEMLLTRDNSRWAKRTKVWKEGWRNLHFDDAPAISADFVLEGVKGTAKVHRSWATGAEIAESEAWFQPTGQKRQPFSHLGWADALANYRPFLPYNELGAMLEAGPSQLFDALSAVLGLGDLVDAQDILRQERLEREQLGKEVRKDLQGLLDKLEQNPDERASRCLQALAGRVWDLETAARIVTGEEEPAADQSDIQALRQLSSLEPPPKNRIDEQIRLLRKHGRDLERFRGSDVDRDRRVAKLLEESLELHKAHGDMDCPVCGEGRIEPSWRERTLDSLKSIRERVADYEEKLQSARKAARQVREWISPAPPSLMRAARLGVDTSDGLAAFGQWTDLKADASPDEIAGHLEKTYPVLQAALELIREEAAAELERRQTLWRPVAVMLSEWLSKARKAESQFEIIGRLKEAEKWLKQTSADIRDERFQPIASEVSANWEKLRQQSNVDLGRIALQGSGPQRRVTLDVTVDGVPGVALGVMSQGELHSLALSLFLPRATLRESPFRFVVIDDPVQSMDPARVDGLARVLQSCAEFRQVLVFTHDARLVEAVRRLQIEATILEVTRRTNSGVEIRLLLDPVERYLEDANALVSTPELPEEASRRVVPGLCRMALESVMTQSFRRRRLGRGQSGDEIEEELGKAGTLTVLASLALFDRGDQGGAVLSRLNKFGRWAGDAYQGCQQGAHGKFSGDLEVLVRDSASLVAKLRGMV